MDLFKKAEKHFQPCHNIFTSRSLW